MKSLLAVISALVLLILPAQVLAADDPVSCVQTYLAGAGYPVGAIDGKLGKATIALGSEFAQTYPELKLPKLSKSSAAKWCDKISDEAGQAILESRALPEVTAPPDTIAESGGLAFDNPLVAENYGGVGSVFHGFERSLWPGRVTVDTNHPHSGAASIRMHLLPGDCGWSTNRDAAEWNDCQHVNERVETNADPVAEGEWYYGLSLMLDANILELAPFENKWAMDEINLFQWFQYDSGACFNLQFNTRLKQLNIDFRCPNAVMDHTYKKVLLADSRANVWHEFVFHVNWTTDRTGFFRVLQNGKMVMAYDGPTIVEAGRPLIVDHPQIYAYGQGDGIDPDSVAASVQYRSPVTVWFDDMVRSTDVADIQQRYDFDLPALSDYAAAIPFSDLDPGLVGEPELYAEGEADRVPVGAIGPGAKLPGDIVSGFKDAVRGRLTNSKAYGLARVADPAGGPKATLRFELRPGDCGKEAIGDWDNCAHGQESVWSATATEMKSGEHYTLSWRAFVEGPKWSYSGGEVALVEIGQPVADDHLMVTSAGLSFKRANDPQKLLLPANEMFDTWNDFVLDVVWARGSKGRMTLTMNGKEVYSYSGPTLPEGEARPSFGIRRNGFKTINSIVYYQDIVLTKIGK